MTLRAGQNPKQNERKVRLSHLRKGRHMFGVDQAELKPDEGSRKVEDGGEWVGR
ncbi:hypothetical protein [Leptolyngbya sp. GGD]|uniref:hypothetical protein n=1 Tax=Leptolyngbya sp. GGD TaxID=2997907 RepID=UPI00227CDD8B|nr:hypothetical protein [Leptolyngbya sp. GGD]MCY6492108.1 hypothetical protein [Leptolyngbya sp. GGD]